MVLRILPGGRRPVPVAAGLRSRSAGQPAEIEGLSTTGVSCPSSSRASASHSAAASFAAGGAVVPSWHGEPAWRPPFRSHPRPRQPGSLQREQRTVRPAGPRWRIDGVRCCTMRANDMHGARLYVSLPGCYIATVNESETITAAKPFCPVRSQTIGPRAQSSGSGPWFTVQAVSGFRPRPMSSGAELGSVRKCRFAVRARPGDSARPYFPDSGAFLPVLTGPSGAGKTSLLRLLFLSIRPTRGLVNLFGQDVSLLGKDQVANMRQRIGIVLQDFRLLDHMTTYENRRCRSA